MAPEVGSHVGDLTNLIKVDIRALPLQEALPATDEHPLNGIGVVVGKEDLHSVPVGDREDQAVRSDGHPPTGDGEDVHGPDLGHQVVRDEGPVAVLSACFHVDIVSHWLRMSRENLGKIARGGMLPAAPRP